MHLELWDTSCWICQQELCDPGYWLGQSPSTNWTGCESLTLEPATCNSCIGTTLIIIPPSETPSHHSFGNPGLGFRLDSGLNQGHDEAKPMLFLQGQLGVKSLNTKNMNQTRLCGPEILKLWPYLCLYLRLYLCLYYNYIIIIYYIYTHTFGILKISEIISCLEGEHILLKTCWGAKSMGSCDQIAPGHQAWHTSDSWDVMPLWRLGHSLFWWSALADLGPQLF